MVLCVVRCTLPFHYWLTRHSLADIEAGQEVYIDYGDSWQMAWDAHVQHWKPPPRADHYRPAVELNADDQLILPTRAEGQYPGVHVLCRKAYMRLQGHRRMAEEDDEEEEDEIDEDDVDSIAHTVYCRPSRRFAKDDDYLYTAELYQYVDRPDHQQCYEVLTGVLFAVPRDAFLFADMAYARDIHQPWSFRHPMGIPDEIMPELWKNR
jgi:hypothetical protein